MYGEKAFERFLWSFRYVLLIAVVGLLLGCLVFLLVGVNEMVGLVITLVTQISTEGLGSVHDIYVKLLLRGIVGVDDILLATALLIFGLGIYDLFISRIDLAEQQGRHSP